ncbi:uncharacterized protein LOC113772936 [Coffea eugenioides]|uniref:uncharacterized protein LOC113772936 n=1 Tax=Coffea eugenioides TaxID=49369 RepID=UPI000F60AE0C|nr:uncharacterized protein LOC113772936 [Coffea eugenioides]
MEGTGEEAPTDIDMDIPIAEAYNRMKKLKPKRKAKVNKEAAVDGEDEGFSVRKENTGGDKSEFPHGITVSLFDDSVENHFKAVDNISKLCGETDMDDFDPAEIQRLSSSITFLREWREFNYPSRNLRFSCQNQSKEGRDFMGEISLPQFSSATVPKKDIRNGDVTSSELSKDFVMYVGGSVWALDWCPRVHSYSDSSIKSEFIAVAAHPPESSYHKIGAPLRGRGFVQIWCVLGTNMQKDMQSQDKKKRKRTSRNSDTVITESSEQRRPRGRPRKQTVNGSSNNTNSHSETVTTESSKQQRRRGKPRNQPINGSSNNTNSHSEKVQTSAVQYLQDSSAVVSRDVALVDTSDHENVKTKLPKQMKPRGRRPKKAVNNSEVVQTPATKCSSTLLTGDLVSGNTCNHVLEENSQLVLEVSTMKSKSVIVPSKRIRLKDKGSTRVQVSKDAQEAELSLANPPTEENLALNMITCDFGSANCSIPNDVALPRMVFCLAHNGEVAWDAKWRPCDVSDKQRMGYLAVLLGDGALEVWEVPFPRTMKVIYSASQKEGTDPRFIRLRPVFRCPTIKRGGRQSIPLTLEWSASSPHDIILAGCHDGVVALWKFCATGSLQETRPLLCFSADTVTIRALTWVPVSSYSESANIIVTAGHRGLKFWDLRDPFRPLWDFYPFQRVIYSLDWLPDPRCIIVSFDDGTLRILSLLKAANDAPVTGKPFEGAQQKGFHSYLCSPFQIWSVHTSRLTGMVAYCGADGTALRFQLTTRAVEKDPLRNRAPHFLCGALTEENSTLTMFTSLPNTPFPMRKSLHEWGEAPRTVRGYISVSNQEKRAKQKIVKVRSEEKHKALCKRGDLDSEFGPDCMVVTETREAGKVKTSSNSEADQRPIMVGEDNPDIMRGEVEEVEVFPSKTVAMHRVRWNTNKGSENWLCYGGAAGVVRFQEIDMCGE